MGREENEKKLAALSQKQVQKDVGRSVTTPVASIAAKSLTSSSSLSQQQQLQMQIEEQLRQQRQLMQQKRLQEQRLASPLVVGSLLKQPLKQASKAEVEYHGI